MPAGTLQEDIYQRHISCWAPLGKGHGAGAGAGHPAVAQGTRCQPPACSTQGWGPGERGTDHDCSPKSVSGSDTHLHAVHQGAQQLAGRLPAVQGQESPW